MPRSSPLHLAVASALAVTLVAGVAGAQSEPAPSPLPPSPPPQVYPPPPGSPQQAYTQPQQVYPPLPDAPQQGYPQQGYGQGAPPQGYPPPGYAAPYGYAPYGYGPPLGPPPPPPPPAPPSCCRFSVRYDPFDLLFRRVTFEGEVALWGPIALEIVPSYIFGSPYDNLDAKGFAIAGNLAFYPGGTPLRGFWVKAHVGWEGYNAVLTHSQAAIATSSLVDRKYVNSPILGGMIGSTTVFGRNGGFAISGGIGIGVATAKPVMLTAEASGFQDEVTIIYDKAGRIQLLGSLSLGASF